MQLETPFTTNQKEYLSGFFAGANQRFSTPGSALGIQSSPDPVEETVHGTPIEDLCKEERIKHEQNGLDCYDRIAELAQSKELPQGADVFRFKFYGLFNVSPAQESLMLRCRIAGGILKSHQLEGLAELAESYAGGYADLTTRANVQFREIQPENGLKILDGLVDLGLTSRGAGADNLRNITASPTAGFDPQEIYDVRPLAKGMHHLILNTREFYGLPRKFNISFDGGGSISVCADTNDIAFYAVAVPEGKSIEPGVYFRVQLAGITGHKQFASDSGILVKPEQCLDVAAAMIRVFIENGDRTNRKKARLKYLIDKWGMERFVDATAEKLPFDLPRIGLDQCVARSPIKRHAHIGVHPQTEEGLNYLGVAFPVGRMLPEQMRAIANVAQRYGRSELRLTVWQNLLVPYLKTEDIEAVIAELEGAGLDCRMHPIKSGIVACTGSRGCKFAAADTKGNALELSAYLSEAVPGLDQPINIHLTGCPHSCAQHYVGDIGLQGVKVKVGDESVDGYNIVLGGGVDDEQGIAAEVFKSVPFDETKPLLKTILERYLELRQPGESFIAFNRRHSAEDLQSLYSEPVLV